MKCLVLLFVFLTFSIVNCDNETNKTETEQEKTDCTAFLIGELFIFLYRNNVLVPVLHYSICTGSSRKELLESKSVKPSIQIVHSLGGEWIPIYPF